MEIQYYTYPLNLLYVRIPDCSLLQAKEHLANYVAEGT